jgi:hypothetical protein
MRIRRIGMVGPAAAAMLTVNVLAGCGADTGASGGTAPSSVATVAAPLGTTAPAPAAARRTEKWSALEAADCLQDPPPSDPGVVMVTVVDCTMPHAAEVYLRAPVVVNAAIADVANRRCAVGFSQYTGQPVGAGGYSITYLIDSEQDRTSNNPLPSTIICMLQDADGGPLTGSAHH